MHRFASKTGTIPKLQSKILNGSNLGNLLAKTLKEDNGTDLKLGYQGIEVGFQEHLCVLVVKISNDLREGFFDIFDGSEKIDFDTFGSIDKGFKGI
jgi:hypothetical protein